MKLIEGKPIAEAVYEECLVSLEELKQQGHLPGLAVVLVGDDPASHAYVAAKDRKCKELGLHSVKIELVAETTQEELNQVVDDLNNDTAIHGILVQMPLPKHLSEDEVILRIDPAKDVDGLHPINIGKIAMDDPTGFAPCTPSGCQRMLIESELPIEGQHVVIVGRSLLVGKTLALLMMGKGRGGNATVTVAHSRTRDLPGLTRQADILVAAIGIPKFIGPDHVKEGAVVIDVGINRIDDPSAKKGTRLVGDVDLRLLPTSVERLRRCPEVLDA